MSSISAGKLNTNAMVHLGDRTGELVFKTNTNVTALTLDSAQKATFTGDVVVAGNLTINGTTTSFGDGDKLVLGDADDLQIFHDGSNSFVSDRGTGNLVLDTNGGLIKLASTQTDKTMATFNKDGSVDLYHDNSIKLQTTSAGVSVTGTLTAGTLTDGVASLNSGALSNATTGSFSNNVTIGGTLGVTSTFTASGLTYPITDGTANQALVTNGSGTLSFANVSLTPQVIRANTTAVAGNHYFLDSAGITLTLPASPSAGDRVGVSELVGDTTSVIAGNGSNIMKDSADLTIDTAYLVAVLAYTGDSSVGWAFA